MKILVLCDRPPYPLTNGQNLRIFHYVSQLKGRHAFDLICYGDGRLPIEVSPMFDWVSVAPRPPQLPATGLRRLLDAVDVERFILPGEEVRGVISGRLCTADYDLIWVSGWDMIVNLPKKCRVPVLADAVDDGVFEWWGKFRHARGAFERMRLFKRVVMNARFERRYFGSAQGVLFVADADARVFQRIAPKTPTYVVHNGVDIEYFRPLGGPQAGNSLVFEGNMGFAPNIEAAVFFVREVMPLIKKRHPVRLTLVGNRPSAEVMSLAGEDVEVTGFVEDIRPLIDRASVFVCPMLTGAGIKNKLLQAWAMAKPVVATAMSTGGLLADDGHNILIANKPEAIADAIIRLLRDPAIATRLGNAARQTVEKHYTWEAKSAELEKAFFAVSGHA